MPNVSTSQNGARSKPGARELILSPPWVARHKHLLVCYFPRVHWQEAGSKAEPGQEPGTLVWDADTPTRSLMCYATFVLMFTFLNNW